MAEILGQVLPPVGMPTVESDHRFVLKARARYGAGDGVAGAVATPRQGVATAPWLAPTGECVETGGRAIAA